MNEPILDGLYYGGISAVARRPSASLEKEYLNHKIEEERRRILDCLPAGSCERLEALGNLYTQANLFEERDRFGYGVRFGIMLMCEIFCSGEGSLVDLDK